MSTGPKSPADSFEESLPSVCVVTHPLGQAGENATRTLLDIFGAITSVSLITAALPADSSIREEFEIVEITEKATGSNIITAAIRFVFNQIRMSRELLRRDEEIVLFFGATAYLIPMVIARISGHTVIVEPRGDVPLTLKLNWERKLPTFIAGILAGLVRALERFGFWFADRVVTYTPEMARELDLDPETPDVYPHGARYVDTENFSSTRPYEERDTAVGFIGRLDEEKGIRELAKVAKKVPDGVTFRFVGDGPLRGWLQSELADEIDSGSVILTGWVDHEDVPAELNQLKLLVMPSQPTEGLPTTILESLACGTPVYASPVAGVPDVVKEGETGFLMDSRDPETLADSVAEILDRDDLGDISAQGRHLITEKYSFEAAVERYTRLLQELA